jgi:hypothetical protein
MSHHSAGGGPEIPRWNTILASSALLASLITALVFDNIKTSTAFKKEHIVPCELINVAVEAILCTYLLAVGEAEPQVGMQVLALIVVMICFFGQIYRFIILFDHTSNIVKMHLLLNMVFIPQAAIDIFLSIFEPLLPESHMVALMSGMCVRLFLNACLVVGLVMSQKHQEIRRIMRRSTYNKQAMMSSSKKVHPEQPGSPSAFSVVADKIKGWTTSPSSTPKNDTTPKGSSWDTQLEGHTF